MTQPTGTVSAAEIMQYVMTDCWLDKPAASKYLSLSIRTIEEKLDEIPHSKVGRKLLFKRSQLDAWVEGQANTKHRDLHRIANEALAAVCGVRRPVSK
jgi:excisionase family DNA binding protein